jgi:hypothetical protein
VRAWLDKRSATLPADGREAQLADIAAQGGDAAECAASDSFKEQLPHPAAD